MKSRIRLRRTQISLDNLNSSSNPDHKLRYGEALYSFASNAMVIGTNNSNELISNITHRIIAFPKVNSKLIFAGPASGSASYPAFRTLTADDLPSNIPTSKISGLDSNFVTIASLKNKGTADSPVYFDANGNAVATTNKFSNYKTIASLKSKGSADSPVYFDANGNAVATTNKFSDYVKLSQVKSKGSSTQPVYFDANGNAVGLGYTIAKSVPSNAVFTDNNTTYAFQGGNGAFTVTPSGGSAQTVSIGKPATATTADQATKLQTARALNVNLASTAASVSFNGTANVSLPVTGTLALTNGGTGRNTNWASNGVVYKNASNAYFDSVAASTSNQVLMSASNSTLPTWRSANDVVSVVDWSNLAGWNNTYVWDSIITTASSYTTELKTGRLNNDLGSSTHYIYAYTQCTAIANCRLRLSGTKSVITVNESGSSIGVTTSIPANRYCIVGTSDPGNPVEIDTSLYNSVPDSSTKNSWFRRVYFTGASGGTVTTYRSDTYGSTGIRTPDNGQICLYKGMNNNAAAWITELGASNKYTHGITTANDGTSSIHLCRGSLSNIIFGKRQGMYVGNGNNTLTISFNINNIPNVPRALIINSRSKYAAEFNSGGSSYYLIDLMSSLESGTFKPANVQNSISDGNSSQFAIDWANSCKSITLTGGTVPNTLNKVYYWYALA